MSRETLKDFLTQRGSTKDSITITLKDAPDGIGIEPGTGEELLDLSNEISGLLGDYLKHIVDGSSNNYKLKGGNSLGNRNNKGDQIPIADTSSAEEVFIKQGTVLKSKLNEYSNSGKFDESGTPLSTLIDKVNQSDQNNDKLKDILGTSLSNSGMTLTNPSGVNNEIVQATQKMFLKNNRFANVGDEKRTSFTVKPQRPEDFETANKVDNRGTLNPQNKFGEYEVDGNIVSIDELKSLAASLLFKSTGFDLGDSPSSSGNITDVSDQIFNNEIGSNIGKSSGLTKVNFSNIRAKNAKGFPEEVSGESIRAGRGEIIENEAGAESNQTFGATYNSIFRFSGQSLKLHKIQAAIALIALKNIGKSFFDSFINILRAEDKFDLQSSAEAYLSENSKVDIGVYMLGQSRKLTSLKIDNHIFSNVLTNTTYPLGDAIDRGLEVVLGKDFKSDDEEKIIKSKVLGQAPGFWLAVAKSVLKTYETVVGRTSSLNEPMDENDLFIVYKDLLENNKFIRFFNAMAVIGDISLQTTSGVKNTDQDFKTLRDVDSYPDEAAVHKSRKKFGMNKNELSWSQDSTPSMYILPANIIRAASKLNNTVYGASPVRGMFGSKLVKNTFTGIDVDGSYNRIPNEVVKVLEDKLDAEYVPFYIQDLRTNEIISFNAFLDTLTDQISPNFNKVDGYGRMDAVQIYKSTSRNLSVGFTLFATNREDFDAMWYKINKLVTLLYPQWTAGSMVSNSESGDSKFYMPFSQVIGASPIVRLRIGDVIKSNYSRFALARTFGIGDANVSVRPEESSLLKQGINEISDTAVDTLNKAQEVILKTWLVLFGSPHSIVTTAFNSAALPSNQIAKSAMKAGKGAVIQLLSNFLVNGYANPLAVGGIVRQLRDPNLTDVGVSGTTLGKLRRNIDNSSLYNPTTGNNISGGYNTTGIVSAFRRMILKPNVVNGYYSESGKKFLVSRRLKIRVVEKGTDFDGLPANTIGYKVKVTDGNAPKELKETYLIVSHHDILPDPKELFNTSIVGASLFLTDPTGLIDSALNLSTEWSQGVGVPNEVVDFVRTLYASDTSLFMRPENNPFVRAIETTRGRGLAGVMGGINFNWLDNFPWEVDYGARAPMGCKISFSFDVIHDIPPGLDHSGYNRAPLYNVGEIMRNVAGDVYSDGGNQAEFNFREKGAYSLKSTGKNNK